MRTGCSLTVCCSLLPGGGVCAWSPGGGGVPGLRGGGGVPGPGGGGVPGPRGGGVSQHALRQTPSSPLWTEFLTHACENITLAQLRCGPVKIDCEIGSHTENCDVKHHVGRASTSD